MSQSYSTISSIKNPNWVIWQIPGISTSREFQSQPFTRGFSIFERIFHFWHESVKNWIAQKASDTHFVSRFAGKLGLIFSGLFFVHLGRTEFSFDDHRNLTKTCIEQAALSTFSGPQPGTRRSERRTLPRQPLCRHGSGNILPLPHPLRLVHPPWPTRVTCPAAARATWTRCTRRGPETLNPSTRRGTLTSRASTTPHRRRLAWPSPTSSRSRHWLLPLPLPTLSSLLAARPFSLRLRWSRLTYLSRPQSGKPLVAMFRVDNFPWFLNRLSLLFNTDNRDIHRAGILNVHISQFVLCESWHFC